MLETIRSDTVYKVCAVLGTLIVAATPYLSWQYVFSLEDKATGIFEERILTKLDLDSLQNQFDSLKTTLETTETKAGDTETSDYTPAQIRHLLAESEALNRQIEQTYTTLKRLETAKNNLIFDIKLFFAGTLIVTVIGMVVAILGFFGWYFHIRVFPERRRTPRTGTG